MARLEEREIEERLGGLEGRRREGEGIAKEFARGNFKGSVAFVDQLLPAAEEMNPHPDLAISWSKLTVTVTTHSEGGLSENDFELASKIDSLA